MIVMDYTLIFILGIVFGSFLNVCIYRIPNNLSLFHPASSCPSCNKKIPFYHNIPLVSFAVLRGRCKECGIKISIQYPLIELTTGLVSVLLLWRFGIVPEFFFYLFFSYALIVIATIDLKVKLIYNKVLLFVGIAGILLNLLFQVVPWLDAVLGVLTGGVVMWLFAWIGRVIFKKEAMGMGDVKFSAVAGFFLGWKLILVALYFGFLIAMLSIVIMKLTSKLDREQPIPMGPFLAGGLFVFILFGETLIQIYLRHFIV